MVKKGFWEQAVPKSTLHQTRPSTLTEKRCWCSTPWKSNQIHSLSNPTACIYPWLDEEKRVICLLLTPPIHQVTHCPQLLWCIPTPWPGWSWVDKSHQILSFGYFRSKDFHRLLVNLHPVHLLVGLDLRTQEHGVNPQKSTHTHTHTHLMPLCLHKANSFTQQRNGLESTNQLPWSPMGF